MLWKGRGHMAVFASRHLEGKLFLISQIFVHGQHRHHHRRQPGAASQDQNYGSRFEPAPAQAIDAVLKEHGAGSQQHGVDGRKIVVLTVKHDERSHADQVRPSEKAVGSERRPEQKRKYSSDPQGRNDRLHDQALLQEVFERAQCDVPAFRLDVAHELEEGPVVVNVPDEIGQENQERSEAADPNPPVGEYAALLGQKQANNHAETKHRNGIFLFHSDPGHHPEPQPIARLFVFGRENRKVCAARP